ncbi:hypothetical protein [Actinoallomurus rhizosphaericola]|uniref:hypothetical protein n=1 Tax=Actinoallomurus rhizosphaericola TaxID=2952536 RepID=UPI00209223EF|nr:hypothetical protein [Actinoallomurus rhizosphaericola]MCO5995077.1 hypothetical protein [Actinoallomurus rhizosphaericola]
MARQTHPLENSLALVTVVAGLATFVLGAVHATHLVAVCLGIVTFLFGLYSQLVSATTAERWLNILGIGMAFVGLGLGLSHGGFTV